MMLYTYTPHSSAIVLQNVGYDVVEMDEIHFL